MATTANLGESSTHSADETKDSIQVCPATADRTDSPHDAPPDGGYGWVCAVAAAVVNAHSWGFNSAYAVFLAYYLKNNIFPSASRLEYAFVGSLSLTTMFLLSPVATISTQRYGIQRTMFVGVILESASLIAASFASQIWHLFLTQGVLFGMGMGMLFIPVASVVPQWFTSKRSLASGVSLSGAGLGGFVYSLVTEAMIRNIGLSWAFRVLGLLAFIVNTTCVLLIRDRNKKVKVANVAIDIALFKSTQFNLLIGFSFFTILGYFILVYSLANYGEEVGLSSSQASLVSGVLNLGQAIGRPLIGYFSDKVGRINIAGFTTFLAGVICLAVWINAENYGVLMFFAIFEGLFAGNFWATIAPLVAEVFGLERVSGGMNIVWLCILIPATFSEPIALELTITTGNYLSAQLFAGFMYIAASVFLAILWFQRRS
ncbi:Major facilitator superfamily domain general substrate transporter [Penicillium atrosanguineum]|uniref:Major facilitator superfamily domain general substrate transporter n=1 Tax=Penicillium atrosanguineum TaxID=1132637 RepID=A0A9W9L6I7_9EURO|nr:Major facilitator superfamily domain general substrate transporter [Penicillium atrosanguineum]KAJ5139426.1 Major facilitator superfamily domain general substrate transporter [Penicillium atrosanguineum]KAJ5314862.1 Major facilitator superfamily domain general substrate transporter [Penicillium atrosanguineum]